MSIIDNVTSLFKKSPVTYASEAAWAEETLYSVRNGDKYNPDRLIGTKGYRVYSEMMTDAQVKSVVTFKRDAITAREYYFEFSDSQKEQLSDAEQEKRIRIFMNATIKMQGSFLDALNGIMTGMYNGFSMNEKVYAPITVDKKTWIGIKYLKLRPFSSFIFNTDEYGNVKKLTQRIAEKEIQLNPKKFIHYVHNPEIDSHYGGSDLRAAHRAWFSKKIIMRMHNIYMERMAGGLLVLKTVEGKVLLPGSAEYDALVKVLKNIQTKTAMILPSKLDLDVHYPNTGGEEAYIRTVAMHDKEIAKALLVPNLLGITEQGQTGSYSQSQTQLEAFMWTLNSDAMRLAEVLNEQLFRELGDINFGDGLYPLFTFKDLSEESKYSLARIWLELINAGAVQASNSDETFIRESLGIPAKEEEEETLTVDPQTALTGQQITTLMSIIDKVVSGEYKKETAVAVITSTFPFDKEQAEEMLKDVELRKPEDDTTEVTEDGTAVDGTGKPTQNAPDNISPTTDDDEATSGDSKKPSEQDKQIVMVSREAFSRSEKRVAFAVIDKRSTEIEQKGITAMGKALGKLSINMLNAIPDITAPEAVKQLKILPGDKRRFKTIMRNVLKDAWELGKQHADIEIKKAATDATLNFRATPLSEEAADIFFENRAGEMALSLSDSARKKISIVMFNGIKNNWSVDDITNRITQEIEQLTASQIASAVRTSVFEAINEARFNYFSDPALDGFVEALQYSAVLDGRTTQICKHLNGKVYTKDSEQWQTNRPPNHFNCRSILLAVTSLDTWEESEPPTITPNEGFA